MKTNKLLFLGMLPLFFAACSGDNDLAENTAKKDVNTYAGLIVSLQAPITRAEGVSQQQADNIGREAENTLARMGLVSSLTSKYWENYNASKPATPTGNDFWRVSNATYTVGAFPASAGAQRMGLMMNYPVNALVGVEIGTGALCKSWNSETDNTITDIAKLSAEGAFTMSSVRKHYTVLDNIDEEEVNNQETADNTKNVFEFNVERLVAQAIVTKTPGLANTTTATANSRVSIDLDNLTYAVINGATTINFWADDAGDRTISNVSSDPSSVQYKYNNLRSAIHDWLGVAGSNWNDAKIQARETAKLIRLGNYSPVDRVYLGSNYTADDRATKRTEQNDALGGYKAIPVFDNGQMSDPSTPVINQRGIYFLENSVGQASYTTDNKDVGFYRLTYAKVYGTITPIKIYGIEYVDDEAGGIKVSPSNSIVEYTIVDDQATKDAMPETSVAEKIAKAHTYVKGTTFYRGQIDDILYTDALAAMVGLTLGNSWTTDAEKTANAQPYWKYLDARCAWRALLNRQTGTNDDDDITLSVSSANTRRNNIYWLEIGEFQKIGMPYDPSDPDDPNLPEPPKDDPTDPTPEDPDDPDIEVQHTYMKVIAHVLNWNVVRRNAIFY